MQNLMELLQQTSKDFEKSRIDFEKNLEQINKTKSIRGLYTLNGEQETKRRLKDLSMASTPATHERIIGTNCLMDFSYFKKTMAIAKTVCRVVRPKGTSYAPQGTGFLIGPGLMMTNNHVIRNKEMAESFMAEFEYERDINETIGESFFFRLNPTSFFVTNKELDYTIVGVEAIASNDHHKKLDAYKWVSLKSSKNKIIKGEAMSIIQHPMGQPKMIAIRENKVVEINDQFIHYTTDTQPGSSGSLVANDQWEIVALHRAGVPEKDTNGDILLSKGGIYKCSADDPFIIWKANQGVLIDSILEDLHIQEIADKSARALKRKLLVHFEEKRNKKGYRLPNKKRRR